MNTLIFGEQRQVVLMYNTYRRDCRCVYGCVRQGYVCASQCRFGNDWQYKPRQGGGDAEQQREPTG